MFQYAFAKSLEVHTRRHVYIDIETPGKKIIGEKFGSDTFREYGLNNFKISLKPINRAKRCVWNYTRRDKWYYEIIKVLEENGKYPYKYFTQNGMRDISLPIPSIQEFESNTYIKGWFQSEQYFYDIRNILLEEFRPKKETLYCNNLIEAISKYESVSVHIRRGDYKRSNMVLDKKYYDKAINMICNKVKNPIWIVFSDEIDYIKENYYFPGKMILIDNSYMLKDYEELVLMSKCKHNIIANSTFSWWGAWLNQNENKCIVAPTRWFSNQNNIVPSSWIKL